MIPIKAFKRASPLQNSLAQTILIEKAQATSFKGLFKFNKLKLITNPNKTIVLKITINLRNDFFFTSTQPLNSLASSPVLDGKFNLFSSIKIFVRSCLRGEILMPHYTCYFCLKGRKIQRIKINKFE